MSFHGFETSAKIFCCSALWPVDQFRKVLHM
jgi:hypothetical protein